MLSILNFVTASVRTRIMWVASIGPTNLLAAEEQMRGTGPLRS
jgi:hypothetical protein